MSKRYKIKTIADCVDLVASLPPERAEVFLKELPLAIIQQASVKTAAKSMLAKAFFPSGFIWVDDDKGTSDMNLTVKIKRK